MEFSDRYEGVTATCVARWRAQKPGAIHALEDRLACPDPSYARFDWERALKKADLPLPRDKRGKRRISLRTAMAVLLMLATHLDGHDGSASPGQDLLAREAKCDVRAVRDALVAAEEAGLLGILHRWRETDRDRPGHARSNIYVVLPPNADAPRAAPAPPPIDEPPPPPRPSLPVAPEPASAPPTREQPRPPRRQPTAALPTITPTHSAEEDAVLQELSRHPVLAEFATRQSAAELAAAALAVSKPLPLVLKGIGECAAAGITGRFRQLSVGTLASFVVNARPDIVGTPGVVPPATPAPPALSAEESERIALQKQADADASERAAEAAEAARAARTSRRSSGVPVLPHFAEVAARFGGRDPPKA
jgi:hypothetical protein